MATKTQIKEMEKEARRILDRVGIEYREISALGGTPTLISEGILRWEFKVFLKSNTGEQEEEKYLNITTKVISTWELVDKE